MNSPVSFLTNLRQDRLQRSEMFSWNKIINALKRSRGNINPFTTFKPSGWKCYKTNFPRASYLHEHTMKKWYIITDFSSMRISQMKQTPKHFRTSLQNQNEDWFSWFGLIFLPCFFPETYYRGPHSLHVSSLTKLMSASLPFFSLSMSLKISGSILRTSNTRSAIHCYGA